MDEGFHAKRIVCALQELVVRYILKVPAGSHVIEALGSQRMSTRAEGIFEEAETVYMNSGRLWGDRLLSLEGRRPLEGEETLELDTCEIIESIHILTNEPGIHAFTAWRAYNAGAGVEHL